MRRSILALCALVTLLALPAAVRAGGFTYPGNGAWALTRGGAFTARADDPSAIMYNPAGLARLKGTHILVSGNVIWEDIRFQRRIYDPKTGTFSEMYPHKPNLRMPEVQNTADPFLSPMIAVSTDLGLNVLDRLKLKILAGFYGPHTHNTRDFPRDCVPGTSPCEEITYDPNNPDASVDSPARYDTAYINMLVMYPSLGLAWEPLPGLRIGGVFQVTYNAIKLETTVTGTMNKLKTPEDTMFDLDITVESEDTFTPTGVLGIHWAPLSFLEFGASVRIGFAQETEGTVTVDSRSIFKLHNQVKPNPADISITWHMPWIVRTGVRFVERDEQGRERFDLEFDFVWESTSQMDQFEIETNATFNGVEFGKLNQDHNWEDTWSLRLGGSYQLWDLIPDGNLRFSLGGFYDSEAMSSEYTRLDFLPLSRWGLSVGVGATWRWLSLTVGYMHIFHDTREASDSNIKSMAPLNLDAGTTIGSGTLKADIDILIIGLKVAFGGGETPNKPSVTFGD